MNTILNIHSLKKSYNGHCILNIESLSIQEKSIYGLIGPNGAGKSTLMKAILGLIEVDAGEIELFGQKVTKHTKKKLNKQLGSLIESPSFYEHLTAKENLAIICELKGIEPSEIMTVLEVVGLSDHANKKVKAYSLGMKQRIGIAIALIGKPKLLILDEPINGLDPYGIEEMRELFLRIVKLTNTSILISSHILDEIEKIASHIGILKAGQLVYNGSLTEYRQLHPPVISITTSNNQLAAQLLNLSDQDDRHQKLVLGKRSNQEIAEIIAFLADKLEIYRVEEEKESLEKLFIKETQNQ
ncbi:ABC transporter ATP-binding protein [Aerococcus urinaehominis]|uniref:ABC transporter ATP-binding protein n=1 Tax=Aerococcus urinaehominis TaxID=128944 RepID=A0A0X8FLB5_9LACT|nr:ATP-binding cassette domain-containing protein [Aerococcus urinaehominis]AMB98722.1 ABC transporter ATP-binding protein [Aerococcus urinaehominis]SDM00121.1 ABC-2 type transport system ATP-binding protein [Aerococcus urinaehominis]